MDRICDRHGDHAHRECVSYDIKRNAKGCHEAEGRTHGGNHYQVRQQRGTKGEKTQKQHDRDNHSGQRIEFLRVRIDVG